MPISNVSKLPPKNDRTGFQWKMREMICLEYEWAFHYQFFAVGVPWVWISHIVWL
jgi:hypothetical protein